MDFQSELLIKKRNIFTAKLRMQLWLQITLFTYYILAQPMVQLIKYKMKFWTVCYQVPSKQMSLSSMHVPV